MLARLLVRLFGGIWALKERCRSSGLKGSMMRFVYGWYQFEHGSAIAVASQFNGPPSFPRGMKQIVIGEDVEVGKNCTILHQVSIDSDALACSESQGSPVIGDNCYIYPGAKIIGKLVIGHNVIVRANAVVTQNVPDNSIVESSGEVFARH